VPPTPSRPWFSPYTLSAVLAFGAGAYFRLWNLRPQILGGDELHGVRTALSLPLGAILSTYRESDNCIPLTAFYRVWGLAGGWLTETVIRLPVVLAGLALLWALPRALHGRLPGPAIAVFRWLLALSPLLILYSRIARSYLPLVLFASLAVFAFERWWQGEGRRYALAYVAFGALASWFHLGAATFVAAPGLYALGDLALGRAGPPHRWMKLRRLAGIGLATAVSFALFLLPAWGSLTTLVAGKRQAQDVPWRSVLPDVFRLYAGTASVTLAILCGLLALLGLVLLVRRGGRDRRLALFTVTVAAGHLAGLLALSPLGLASPAILGRYLLPILPFLLLWVACGVALPWQGEGETISRRRAQAALAAGLLAALFFSGPLNDRGLLHSSFVHHNDFARFLEPRTRLAPEQIPAFYRRLASEPGDGAIVEYPWLGVWEANRSFYAYQAIHGRRVIVGTPQRLLFRPPAALHNAVAPEPGALCRSGAEALVVHLNVEREEVRLAAGRREPLVTHRMRQQLREMALGLGRRLRAAWGEPAYADRWIAVWDLRAACGGRTQSAAPAVSASAASPNPATKVSGR
jgi:hypothetical protein